VLRLETLKEVGSTFAQLRPTLEAVKEVSNHLAEVMPEVSNELSNIGSILDETMVGMSIDSCQESIMRIPDSILGEEILEEASKALRSRIEEELPLPPKDIPIAPAIMIGGEQGEDDESMGGVMSMKVVTNIADNVGSREGAILYYLKTSGGEFDLSECSSSCNVPEQEVPSIIEKLSRKGLIKIMTV